MEDFTAHSNWIELALIDLGYHDIFPHVGVNTQIMLDDKRIFPLTTGTFGSLDFVHSLLGEATDKLSQTQIAEVSEGFMATSNQTSSELLSTVMNLLRRLPGLDPSSPEFHDMQSVAREADDLRSQFGIVSEHATIIDADAILLKIYPVLALRDRVMKRSVIDLYTR